MCVSEHTRGGFLFPPHGSQGENSGGQVRQLTLSSTQPSWWLPTLSLRQSLLVAQASPRLLMQWRMTLNSCPSRAGTTKLASAVAYLLEAEVNRRTSWQEVILTYLDHISRLVYVLFKDQHGGGIDVDVILPGHLFHTSQADVHIPEGHVIFVCKGRQLWGQREERESTA